MIFVRSYTKGYNILMFLLFDIGGTNTRLAISDDGKTFSRPHIYKTPKDPEEGIRAIAEFAQGKGELKAAGGGIAGPVDWEKGMLVNSPHLAKWINFPFKDELSDALGCPVYVANDTQIVGLGEAVHGAGRGNKTVVYMTISTGVGGARIIDEEIDSTLQFSEIGHQIIALSGIKDMNTQCPFCGGEGELEAVISGTAIEKRTGKKPYETHDQVFWEEVSGHTAIGVYNSILYWSPDIVVLGGSMMKSPGILLDKVQSVVAGMQNILPTTPAIVKAELKDIGGLYGAMTYINYLHGKR